MHMRRFVVIVSIFFVVILAAGVSLWSMARQHVAGQLQPPALTAESAEAPDMVFHTLEGRPLHLSDFRGKVIFLDLWGTWCLQCVAEMPTVQKLYSHYKDDPTVVFLIVSRMDSPATVVRYARRNSYTLPFYVTKDEDVPPSMYFHQYPATFLYTKDGRIAAHHAGGADWADSSVIRFIDRLKEK